jgi:cobalt/nickel transport system permease protein
VSDAVLELWAVHISDGVLTAPWLAGGFAVAGLLALLGAWRIKEEQIAQVALLTAAFFVASLIHVRIGPTSVHLLLNGLIGVVLGRRAGLAIPVGLFLQAALLGHGGFTTLGVNSCVIALPALLAWQLFVLLRQAPWVRQWWFRGGLVGVSVFAFTVSFEFAVGLFAVNGFRVFFGGVGVVGTPGLVENLEVAPVAAFVFHPLSIAAVVMLSVLAAWGERRLENAPEFPLGLLVGVTAVLGTVLLNCLVLIYGGQEDWRTLALFLAVAHLPVAVVEGAILGFAIGFLAKVKPEMLRWPAPEKRVCAAESVVQS